MKKECIRFEEGAAPFPQVSSLFSFVPPVKAGNWIFIALANGTGATFGEQLTNILEEVKWSLESAGSSMENMVSSTVFFVHLARDTEEAFKIWPKYFPRDNPHATAWIGIKELVRPHLLVEIACTAMIPDGKS